MIAALLSNRICNTNPYETNEQAASAEQEFSHRSSQRIWLLAVVSLVGIGNTSAALIDAYREGYPTLEGYLFIGITTFIPMAFVVAGMLILIVRRLTTYLLWSAGAFVALLPGLIAWTVCAVMPSPGIYSDAGQMHIFFLPVIHIGYCFLVYLGTGLLALVVSRIPEA